MTEGLNPMDLTGVSFWLLSAAMTAATFFFFMERDRAVGKWKTSLSVAALVTGIAAIHYFYMRVFFGYYLNNLRWKGDSLAKKLI